MLVCTCAVFASAAAADLDARLDAIAPEYRKWATVCVVTTDADGAPAFAWHDYRESGSAIDFWPASTIKLYTAIAALELLNERSFPFEDTTVAFERRVGEGPWVLDCARGVREMIGEVFRRSSNEDYTLLLRMTGIDWINTHLLTRERGFPHSALMRGYVLGQPYGYRLAEAQRITLRSIDGRTETFEHTWSGRYYAEERGGAQIDARTGNLTSPRELAECVRRIFFHEHLPEQERYRLTPEQIAFLRHGADGFSGMEVKTEVSGASAWNGGADTVFPHARFFHKSGAISNYALEAAFVDDRANTGKAFILVPVIGAGISTKPVSGEKLISVMSRAISEWVQAQ